MRYCILTAVIVFASLLHAENISGVVVSVHDGDTYTMQTDDGAFIKVRQQAIDAPELKQPYGKESADFNRMLLIGRKIILHASKKDLYGRTLGRTDVVIGTDTVDAESVMLYYGYAWHYREYDKRADYEVIQQDAKENKRGLWQGENPVAPWTYRKNKRNAHEHD